LLSSTSQRIVLAIARKASGIVLGKPKGTIQKSFLDDKQDVIKELLKHRVAKAAIARMVGTSRTNLIVYIRRRNIS
jgi:putative DNA-invertase from lambdoid prophage Rac